MTHLGTQLSALADGRLSGPARERALSHVAACGRCAEELSATRATRRALAAAADVPPAPDLTARLLALGVTSLPDGVAAPGAPVAPSVRRAANPPELTLGGGPRLDDAGLATGTAVLGVGGLARFVGAGPTLGFADSVLGADVATDRRNQMRALTVLAAGAVVAGLFLIGDVRDVVPDSHPAADLALLAAASGGGAGTTPGGGPGAGVEPVVAGRAGTDGPAAGGVTTAAAPTGGTVTTPAATSGVDPDAVHAAWPGAALPTGFTVLGAGRNGAADELDLDGPTGPVVVLRQEGRLSPDVAQDAPVVVVGDRQVHVLSVAPWHCAWQSGDAVVVVVAAHRSSAVDDLVAAYPAEHADDGLGARVSRGWQTVVGAWAP